MHLRLKLFLLFTVLMGAEALQASAPIITKRISIGFGTGNKEEFDPDNVVELLSPVTIESTELFESDVGFIGSLSGGHSLKFSIVLPDGFSNVAAKLTLVGYPENSAPKVKVKINSGSFTDYSAPTANALELVRTDDLTPQLVAGRNEITVGISQGYLGLQTLELTYNVPPTVSFPLVSPGKLYLISGTALDQPVALNQPITLNWQTADVPQGTILSVQYRGKSGSFRDVPGGTNILYNNPNKDPNVTGDKGSIHWNSPEVLSRLDIQFVVGLKQVLPPSRTKKICLLHDGNNSEMPLYNELVALAGSTDCEDLEERLRTKKRIDLSNKGLSDFSLLSDFQQLTELDLSRNAIDSIQVLAPLKNLSSLNLAENVLQSLAGIDALTSLSTLILSGNELQSVALLAKLPNLKNLDLSSNHLTAIPELLNSKFDSLIVTDNFLCLDGHGFGETWENFITGGKIKYSCDNGKIEPKETICKAGLTAINFKCVTQVICSNGKKPGETSIITIEGGKKTMICNANGMETTQSVECSSGFNKDGENCIKAPAAPVTPVATPPVATPTSGPRPRPAVVNPDSNGIKPGMLYSLRSRLSGKCLDPKDNGTAQGTPMQQWECVGSANQKFRIVAFGSGDYALIGLNSGRCLGIQDSSSNNGIPLKLWDCFDSKNERVTLVKSVDGSYTVRFTHDGKCADVFEKSTANGAEVHQWDCAGVPDQDWYLKEEAPNPPEVPINSSATYSLVSRLSGKCLDVPGFAKDNGAYLQQWDCDKSAKQKFWIVEAGGGTYSIVGSQSNRCVSAEAVWYDNGTRMIQWDCAGGPDQKVSLTPTSDGYVKVSFSHSSKCMSVADHGLDNGMKVHQWDCVNVPDQEWKLQQVN